MHVLMRGGRIDGRTYRYVSRPYAARAAGADKLEVLPRNAVIRACEPPGV